MELLAGYRGIRTKVPRKLKKAIADEIRSIFYASSRKKALDFFEQFKNSGHPGHDHLRALADQFGFTGSYASVRRLALKLRDSRPKATCILEFAPGEAAQVDFGKGPTITDVFTGEVVKTWIFVMALCFSRHMYAEIVINQKDVTSFFLKMLT